MAQGQFFVTQGGLDQQTANGYAWDVYYTAQAAGAAGNNILINLVEDGIAGSETVNVTGTTITIHIGNSGVLASTAVQVKLAVEASTDAMALIRIADSYDAQPQYAAEFFLGGGQDAATASFTGQVNFTPALQVQGVSEFRPDQLNPTIKMRLESLLIHAGGASEVPLFTAVDDDGSSGFMGFTSGFFMVNPSTIPGSPVTNGPTAYLALIDYDAVNQQPAGVAIITRADFFGGDPGTLYFGSAGGIYFFDGANNANNQQGDVRAGTFNAYAPQQIDTGTTGQIVSTQPFRGDSYKKVLVFLDNFSQATTYYYWFPMPFNLTPYVYGDAAAVATATVISDHVEINSPVGVSGYIIIEGS
jgi:hypothetical protein